jgi:hypothetical protein
MKAILESLLFTMLVLSLQKNNNTFAQSFEIYQLPEDGNQIIVQLIDEALSNISIVTYSITDHDIANAIARAGDRGINVDIILDEEQAFNNKYSELKTIKSGNLKIHFLVSDKARLISDFGIIDDSTVYVGGAFLLTDIKTNPKFGNYFIFRNNEYVINEFRNQFQQCIELIRCMYK